MHLALMADSRKGVMLFEWNSHFIKYKNMHKYVNTSVILSLGRLGHNLQFRMSTFIEVKDVVPGT